MEQSVAQDAET